MKLLLSILTSSFLNNAQVQCVLPLCCLHKPGIKISDGTRSQGADVSFPLFFIASKHYYYCAALTCLNTQSAAMTETRFDDCRFFCIQPEYCLALACLCSKALSAVKTFFRTDERFCHTKRVLTSYTLILIFSL